MNNSSESWFLGNPCAAFVFVVGYVKTWSQEQVVERIILTEGERKMIENKRSKDGEYQVELQEKVERKKKWNELVTKLSDLLKDSSPMDAEKIFQEVMRKREDYLDLIAERQRSDRTGEEELERHYRKRFDPNFVRDSDPTR